MRFAAGALTTILFGVLATACSAERDDALVVSEADDGGDPIAEPEGCTWEFGCTDGGSGAGLDDGGHVATDDGGTGGTGGDDGGTGGDDGGTGGDDGGTGGDDGGGGTCGDGGSCDGGDGGGGTCGDGGSCDGGDGGDDGNTCDHNGDGHCDGGDCDHDNDGDCDGDEPDGHNDGDCTLTQGFWKNHPESWPVSSLTLGTNVYTKAALLEILWTDPSNNGLTALAHQLIAAKLNVAIGGSATGIASLIADADALIGNLVVGVDVLHASVTSDLNDALDEFNNGRADGTVCD